MRVRLVLLLIALAILTRLLPHPPNFTSLAAVGIFGAAFLEKRRLMYLVPFAALFLSDLFINNVTYGYLMPGFIWFGSFWIYLAFGLVILMSHRIFSTGAKPIRILGASLGSSAVFFLITNFAVWLESGMYPKTMSGLAACYAAGIPFLGNTLAGDLFYCAALFGSYYWLSSRFKAEQKFS